MSPKADSEPSVAVALRKGGPVTAPCLTGGPTIRLGRSIRTAVGALIATMSIASADAQSYTNIDLSALGIGTAHPAPPPWEFSADPPTNLVAAVSPISTNAQNAVSVKLSWAPVQGPAVNVDYNALDWAWCNIPPGYMGLPGGSPQVGVLIYYGPAGQGYTDCIKITTWPLFCAGVTVDGDSGTIKNSVGLPISVNVATDNNGNFFVATNLTYVGNFQMTNTVLNLAGGAYHIAMKTWWVNGTTAMQVGPLSQDISFGVQSHPAAPTGLKAGTAINVKYILEPIGIRFNKPPSNLSFRAGNVGLDATLKRQIAPL